MRNKWWMMVAALLMLAVSAEAQTQKNKKSVVKASSRYAKYVKDKTQGKEKLAQKRSSDPATVTRDKMEMPEDTPLEPMDSMRAAYEQFRQQATTDYENFRDKANQEYADFMIEAWRQFNALPPIPQPEEKNVEPVVLDESVQPQPVEDRPVKIENKVAVIPAPKPQPVPVAPIRETPVEDTETVSFSVYGTAMKVRFAEADRFTLADCRAKTLSEAWKKLSSPQYNNLIRDCLMLRISLQLSDWAYMQMLDKMSKACLGETNEATLLMAFVYCQSGYMMRLGAADDKLYMLYATDYDVYSSVYFQIGKHKFYVFNYTGGQLDVCDLTFPKEQTMSLQVSQDQQFDIALTEQRELKSRRYPDVKVITSVNKNLLDFCTSYPLSTVNNDNMSRWSVRAHKPMERVVQESLYPQLKSKIEGKTEKEAVERLLNWVQTAFVYEHDDVVWGVNDRIFFPEETLCYPYSDCEDRAILLSRLVRDLLGLKTILIYYPGHLAMAVCFSEDVKGDYIMLDGRKFVVCDPTFINAGVGSTMTGYDNSTAQVVLLD